MQMIIRSILPALIFVNCTLADTDPFTRINTEAIVSDGGWSFGVSWVDYDGDTYPDLLVCNEDFSGSPAPNFLYHNNGDGTYTRISEGAIASSGGCLASTWADIDADGDLDCYVARPFLNNNLLFANNGDGTFIKDTSNLITAAKKFSMEVEWVDIDNDGWLDVFVANHGRPSDPALAMIYHNDNGSFVLLSNTEVGLIDDEANGVTWADYDGDGDRDPYWSRNNKLSVLFRNEGNASFTHISECTLSKAPAKYQANWADFDNDGDLDIYTKHGDLGVAAIYKNMGKGRFELAAIPDLAQDTGAWTGGYCGDYDNDGWLDLIVLGNDRYKPHPNRLYHNNGDGTLTRVNSDAIESEDEASGAAAWADHDRDSDLDLFIANVNSANNSLFENQGNDNHWLQVELKGTRSNRSGIGSKIKVKAVLNGKPLWQMREISAKNGFKSQSELIAHFGLSDALIVDSLIVEWPSSRRQVLTDVRSDQLVRIVEQ